MDRKRPISILDDSPGSEPRDSWSRIRETVAADKHSRRRGNALSQILWGLMAIVCLSMGIGGGYYLFKTYDLRGVLESAGFFSGSNSSTAEKREVQKPKEGRLGTHPRAGKTERAESDAPENGGLIYNVEVVDNKSREDDFVAVAKDSGGRIYQMKPAPLPALIIPHALPTSKATYGVATPSLPSPAVKALSLDQYRNLNGSVTLQANIGNDGAVKEYAVLNGPKELVEPALQVAREQRYDPPRKDYAARWTTITVNFKGQK